MSSVPNLDSLDVEGRTALIRADLNVPLEDGEVADDFRIRASLETIAALRERGARVVVCSHLGRPKGRDQSLRMDPIARRLGELGSFPVVKTDDVVGPGVEKALADMGREAVAVLENTRFEPGEKANDPELAARLAALADVFVLDAFGSAHRAHASTVGVAERLPAAAGKLLEAELKAFDRLTGDAEHPFVVLLGGAKISDKLPVITSLLPEVDLMLVGGGMCFTLLAAAGYEVGDSLVEEDLVEHVAALLTSKLGGKVLLPEDVVVADRWSAEAQAKVVGATRMPAGWMGLDIGPKTARRFSSVVANASRLFWNGPMGVFEWEAFRDGTAAVTEAVRRCKGFSVVGGGDSVAALRMFGGEDDVSHVSTGGGAGLALLEGKKLPGIEALRRWSRA